MKTALKLLGVIIALLFLTSTLVSAANSAVVQDSIDSLTSLKNNLIDASRKVDASISVGKVFTIAGCAFDFLPSPFKTGYKGISYEIFQSSVKKVADDAGSRYVEIEIENNNAFETAINQKSVINITNSISNLQNIEDSDLVGMENNEFIADMLKFNSFVKEQAGNFSSKIDEINEAYDHNKIQRALLFTGVGIAIIFLPEFSLPVMVLITATKATSECTIDVFDENSRVGVLTDLIPLLGSESVRYSDKIEEGIYYSIDRIKNKESLPSIEVDTSFLFCDLKVTNNGGKDTNLDVLYDIFYSTNAINLMPQKNFYTSIISFALAPGESRCISLETSQEIKNWIATIPKSCGINQFSTGVLLTKDVHYQVFYGEDETVALKENRWTSAQYFSCKDCDNGDTTLCLSQQGVCKGSKMTCINLRWDIPSCVGSKIPNYELQEVTCDGLDNDCDGEVDEGCTKLKGDTDGNCRVDVFDLARVGLAYGSTLGSSYWNPKADVFLDGKIDIFDLATVGLNYGRTC